MKKITFKLLIPLVLAVYFSLFFVQKISLVTADIGRHIKNGEIILSTKRVMDTNYYSYTQSDFKAINHHWLSGVVFYLVYKAVDFNGLSVFFILLSGLTVFIFFILAKRNSNFYIALFLTLITMPLISYRREVRPEVFSYLFLVIYFYVLFLHSEGRLSSKKVLLILSVTQLLWVNLHIFFILGPFLVGVLVLHSLVVSHDGKQAKVLFTVLIGVVMVSLLNPHGIYGFMEPLNIFKEYGYMVVENQSVFFMQNRFPEFLYLHFEVYSLAFYIMVVYLVTKKRLKENFIFIVPLVFFNILAFKAIRGIPIFSMFFVPFAAKFVYDYIKFNNKLLLWLSVTLFVVSVLFRGHYFSVYKGNFGIGLVSDIQKSAEFFKSNRISGPVFNNYDIGGYLIFNLYPKERVFVDNRPEAYPVSFFGDTYIAPQVDENKWKEISERYSFNVIYFYRLDVTPWAQPFLIKRIKDPAWVSIYVDNHVLILVKNTEQNRNVIDSYKIPKNVFVVS